MDKAARQNSYRPILALTGVRAFVAWWVVAFHTQIHLYSLLPELKTFFAPVLSAGYMRVDLFFILSGFVLSYRYAPEFRQLGARGYGRFMLKRFARIYPVHLFTMAVLLVFAGAAQLTGREVALIRESNATDFLTNLLLIQAWILPVKFSWNFPAWSLSCEWLAYFLFPFLTLLMWRVRSPATAIVSIAALLGAMALSCTWLMENGIYGYDFMIRLLTEFSSGCLLYQLYRVKWAAHWNWSVLSTAVVIVVLLAGALLQLLQLKVFWVAILFAVLIYGLIFEQGIVARIFRSRFFLYWGRLSYSLYMTHALVLVLLVKFFPAQHFNEADLWLRLTVAAAYILGFALAAVATYLLIEQPARRWLQPKLRQSGS